MKTYTDHRKAIKDRLDEMGKSTYWLGKDLESRDEMTMTMLYQYLAGKATTTDKFEAICRALDLKLSYDDGDGKRSRKRAPE